MQMYEIRIVASIPDGMEDVEAALHGALWGPTTFLESFEGVETAGVTMRGVAQDTAELILMLEEQKADDGRVEIVHYEEAAGR